MWQIAFCSLIFFTGPYGIFNIFNEKMKLSSYAKLWFIIKSLSIDILFSILGQSFAPVARHTSMCFLKWRHHLITASMAIFTKTVFFLLLFRCFGFKKICITHGTYRIRIKHEYSDCIHFSYQFISIIFSNYTLSYFMDYNFCWVTIWIKFFFSSIESRARLVKLLNIKPTYLIT